MENDKKICLRNRDMELMLYLSDYGIVSNENVKLLYKSEYYYKNRLASLAKGGIIERQYGKVLLGTKGKKVLNETGVLYRNINRCERYKKRMERMSDIAIKLKECGWWFEPSWRCNLNTYTKRGNRFIGIASRRKKEYGENGERFNKTAYLVYFLHKDITARELKYIKKELDRNKRHFKGYFAFTESEELLYHPKFEGIQYEEAFIVPYNKSIWETFKLIYDEKYMNERVYEIFGDKLVSLRARSYYDNYYIKDGDTYIYIYYMAFPNFDLLRYLNHMENAREKERKHAKVVCIEPCEKYIKKYLDEKVEVICVG